MTRALSLDVLCVTVCVLMCQRPRVKLRAIPREPPVWRLAKHSQQSADIRQTRPLLEEADAGRTRVLAGRSLLQSCVCMCHVVWGVLARPGALPLALMLLSLHQPSRQRLGLNTHAQHALQSSDPLIPTDLERTYLYS